MNTVTIYFPQPIADDVILELLACQALLEEEVGGSDGHLSVAGPHARVYVKNRAPSRHDFDLPAGITWVVEFWYSSRDQVARVCRGVAALPEALVDNDFGFQGSGEAFVRRLDQAGGWDWAADWAATPE